MKKAIIKLALTIILSSLKYSFTLFEVVKECILSALYDALKWGTLKLMPIFQRVLSEAKKHIQGKKMDRKRDSSSSALYCVIIVVLITAKEAAVKHDSFLPIHHAYLPLHSTRFARTPTTTITILIIITIW